MTRGRRTLATIRAAASLGAVFDALNGSLRSGALTPRTVAAIP